MKEIIYTTYAPNSDITFIMRDTYNDSGEPVKLEVIGFYFGVPDDDATKEFEGALIAKFSE